MKTVAVPAEVSLLPFWVGSAPTREEYKANEPAVMRKDFIFGFF